MLQTVRTSRLKKEDRKMPFSWRKLAAALCALLLVPLVMAAAAGSASADSSDPVVSVVNADDGVYWRYEPQWSSSIPVVGEGVYTGDQVSLQCFERGGTVPPYYNNPLWYRATVVSGQGTGSGYVSDHQLSTGTNQPNVPYPGVGPCGLTSFDAVPPAVFNGLDPGKGFGFHQWGPCWVQDFYGSNGHFIVQWERSTGLYHLVSSVMMYGWFANGGAPGKLGCPVGNVTSRNDGTTFQDFQGGQLTWQAPWAKAMLQ